MNEAEDAETSFLRASLARQKQIIADKKKDVESLEQKLRENLRKQDEIYLKLFPPVRPDRNAAYISTLIEEESAELEHLQDAIRLVGTQLNALHERNTLSSLEQVSIAERTEELAKLKRNHAGTYTYLEHLRSLLSPIRVLPVEILTEIFEYCCDTMNIISLSSAPMLVSHVCSAWRAIVIHKCEMWSSLKVVPDHFATKAHGLLPLAKLWLERSGDCPLRLYIRPYDALRDAIPPPVLFVDLVRLYAPHFRRWKDIVLNHTRFTDRNVSLFSSIPDDGSFPFLERFELYSGAISFEDSRKLPRLFRRAPRLQQLVWIARAFEHDPSFPYSQLTTLEVGGDYSITTVLRILSEGEFLQTIDICVFIHSETITSALAQVVHKSLTKVTFTCGGDSNVLFDSMTLPALQDFHITKFGFWDDSTWSQAAFLSFLRRSHCSLTNFGIVDYDLTPANVLEILSVLSPSLINLEFEHSRGQFMTDDILIALTYPTGGFENDGMSSVLCPRLREMKITGCLSSTDGILADMVESRCHPPNTGLAQLQTGLFGINSNRLPRDKDRVMALNGRRVDYMVLEERDVSEEVSPE